VPKVRFLNMYRVQFGVAAAISEFNEGQQSSLSQNSMLSLSPGTITKELKKKKDNARVSNVTKKSAANTEARNKLKRAARAASDAINVDTKLLLYGGGKY
jgi:hypothetical protein